VNTKPQCKIVEVLNIYNSTVHSFTRHLNNKIMKTKVAAHDKTEEQSIWEHQSHIIASIYYYIPMARDTHTKKRKKKRDYDNHNT
jgi:hypothetical protein